MEKPRITAMRFLGPKSNPVIGDLLRQMYPLRRNRIGNSGHHWKRTPPAESQNTFAPDPVGSIVIKIAHSLANQGSVMTPFVLKGAVKLPAEEETRVGYAYDRLRQLWIDEKTGTPAVKSLNSNSPTRYGETSLTETREGADKTDPAIMAATRFGETTQTRSLEGTDQSEITLSASRFGETTVTKTREGTDQSELAFRHFANLNAPYSHF